MFFELAFEEIIKYLQQPNCDIDINLKCMITTAYNGSVKKYHNWMTQQVFKVSTHVIISIRSNNITIRGLIEKFTKASKCKIH